MSYLKLQRTLGLDSALPVTEDWSAAADFLNLISDYCLQHRPQTIVECSSGTSSLVLSRCCDINQYGHVYSLENGEPYAAQTRQQLNDFSLSDFCDVLHAPLRDFDIGSEIFQWYEFMALPVSEIDMLIIDGPPGFVQKQSRFPALPLLYDRLATHCKIFLDDAARQDEQEIIERWCELCPDLQFEYIENDRGCAIFSR